MDKRQLGMGQKYRDKLNFNCILDVNIFYSPEGKDIRCIFADEYKKSSKKHRVKIEI